MRYIWKKVGRRSVEVSQSGPEGLSLNDCQILVGGNIEIVPTGIPGVDAVCNEEGMFCGEGGEPLPANVCGLLGDFLILAYDDEGDQRDMTDLELVEVGMWLERNRSKKHPIHRDPVFT